MRPAPRELVESEENFLAKKMRSDGSNEFCNGLNWGFPSIFLLMLVPKTSKLKDFSYEEQ